MSHEAARSESKVRGGPRTVIKISKFDGKKPLDTFLKKFEDAAGYNGWSDDDKRHHLMAALEGDADQTARMSDDVMTYSELCDLLRQNYGAEEQQERFRQELRGRRQKQGESLQELANAIQNLAIQAYPDETPKKREELFVLSAFLDAIGDPELKKLVRTQEHKTLRAALNGAIKLEVHLKSEAEKEGHRTKNVRAVQQDGDTQSNDNRGRPRYSERRANTPKEADQQAANEARKQREENEELRRKNQVLEQQLQAARNQGQPTFNQPPQAAPTTSQGQYGYGGGQRNDGPRR